MISTRFIAQIVMFISSLILKARLLWLERHDPVRAARLRGVRIGDRCRFIGKISFGSEPYLVTIGDHVSITSATFVTHDGAIWVARDQYPDLDIVGPIIIGNNVFIGSGATILPGVTVGDNVIIGAMSVVTKNIPDDSVFAGVPAKSIRETNAYIQKVIPNALSSKNLDAVEKKKYLLKYFSGQTRDIENTLTAIEGDN